MKKVVFWQAKDGSMFDKKDECQTHDREILRRHKKAEPIVRDMLWALTALRKTIADAKTQAIKFKRKPTDFALAAEMVTEQIIDSVWGLRELVDAQESADASKHPFPKKGGK